MYSVTESLHISRKVKSRETDHLDIEDMSETAVSRARKIRVTCSYNSVRKELYCSVFPGCWVWPGATQHYPGGGPGPQQAGCS